MLTSNGDLDTKKDVYPSFSDLGSLVGFLGETSADNNTYGSSEIFSPISSISNSLQTQPISKNSCTKNVPHLSRQYSSYVNLLAHSNVLGVNRCPLPTKSMVEPSIRQQNVYKENYMQQVSSKGIQKQQKNEISESLKMFAMLAEYKLGNDPVKQRETLVEEIMQDFYCNGYVTDDTNNFRQGRCSMESHIQQYYKNNNNCNKNGNHYNSNFNINYGGNNMCETKMAVKNDKYYPNQSQMMFQLPTHSSYYGSGMTPSTPTHHAIPTAATVATVAAVANIDYNSQTSKKPQKRSGNTKFEKYTAVKHCVFCENNNEPEAVVKSHAVRDSLGRVLCPKLRTYICPICKASGDKAHTVKYCPQKPIITMEDAVKAETLRLTKNTYFKQGMKV